MFLRCSLLDWRFNFGFLYYYLLAVTNRLMVVISTFRILYHNAMYALSH